jgi:hypothetical protein
MRTLHVVKIEIEYFDIDATSVESLLWRLSQATESFSSSYYSRVVDTEPTDVLDLDT